MILKLRVYVSALFVLAAVVVMSCWIRSYWRIDRALYIGNPVTEISSYRGAIHIYHDDFFLAPVYTWDFASQPFRKKGNSYVPIPSIWRMRRACALSFPIGW